MLAKSLLSTGRRRIHLHDDTQLQNNRSHFSENRQRLRVFLLALRHILTLLDFSFAYLVTLW